MTRLRAWLVAPLLVALARPAPGQERKQDAQQPQPCKPTEVVITGTRTPESSQRATVRTEFVTREEAERRGATNVAEALQGEPTLQVNPENYGYLDLWSPSFGSLDARASYQLLSALELYVGALNVAGHQTRPARAQRHAARAGSPIFAARFRRTDAGLSSLAGMQLRRE
jgi:hypothetical protein